METTTSPMRKWIVALLLVLGLQFWLIGAHGYWGRNSQVGILVGVFALAGVGPLRRKIFAGIERMRRPTAAARIWMGLGVGLAAAGLIYWTAIYDGRSFEPHVHDEFAYQIAARQLAAGRLWMPRHPLAEFFESMHLIIDRVYASRMYPGVAIGLVPVVWMHLPLWVGALAWSAFAVGMMYRVTAELVDGAVGLLAAIMLLSVETFRAAALMTMGNGPVLALGLVLIWAWMRWREEKWWVWAVVMGTTAGWAGLTRPEDLLCFVLPVGVAIVFDLWRERRCVWGKTILGGVVGMVPFVALTLIYDTGVTGQWLTAPWVYYAKLYEPHYGLRFRGGAEPAIFQANLTQQKRIFAQQLDNSFAQHASGNYLQWTKDRLDDLLERGLPQPLMWILIPLGVAALWRKTGVVAWGFVIWVLIYAGHFTYFSLYIIAAMGGLIIVVLMGVEALRTAWAAANQYLTVAIYGAIVGLSVTNWPQLNRLTKDPTMGYLFDRTLPQITATMPKGPAVVLFKFDPSWDVTIEPVYNWQVAWPDDAQVIRAHDLGDHRDMELYKYYAQHQPERAIYRYDQKDRSLTFLGTAKELAAARDAN